MTFSEKNDGFLLGDFLHIEKLRMSVPCQSCALVPTKAHATQRHRRPWATITGPPKHPPNSPTPQPQRRDRPMSTMERILRRMAEKKASFNDTATTEIYTLTLHDDLPIFVN